MANLPFHNRIMGILLAQRDAHLNSDFKTQENSDSDLLSAAEIQERIETQHKMSRREALNLSFWGLLYLLPAFLLVALLFVAFIALLCFAWGIL